MAIKSKGGSEKEELTQSQKDVVANLTELGIPRTEYDIQVILPKDKEIINPDNLKAVLVSNVKTKPYAEELTELLVRMQSKIADKDATERFDERVSLLAKPREAPKQELDAQLAEGKIDSKTHAAAVVVVADFEVKKQRELVSDDLDAASRYEDGINAVVFYAPAFARIREKRGDEVADQSMKDMLRALNENATEGGSITAISSKDTSHGKIPLQHSTESQQSFAENMGMADAVILKGVKMAGASDEEVASLAREMDVNNGNVLEANALRRAGKPQNYNEYVTANDEASRKQIMLNSGFNENTIRYLDSVATSEFTSALVSVGLAGIAAALGGAEVKSPGAEAGAAVQIAQMDAIFRQKDAQVQKDEMDKALNELEEKNRKESVGEAEVSDETKDMLKKLGVEDDDTIKEAIEALEAVIANVEMQSEKIESLRKGFNEENWEEGMMPPFHKSPEGVLEANNIMEDGKLTELGKEVMPELLKESAADFMEACDTILFRIEIVGNEELMDKLNEAKRTVEDYMVNPESVEKLAAFNEVMADPEIVAVHAAFFEAIAENAGDVVENRA